MPLEGPAHARWGEHRRDPEWIAEQRLDPRALLLAVEPELRVRLDGDVLGWTAIPSGIDPDLLVFLGVRDGIPAFAVDAEVLGPDRATSGATIPVREALGSVGDLDAGALLQATGMIAWHRRHPHCARCGAVTVPADAGHLRRCTSCGTSHFPRTDPAVIMLVSSGDACVLGNRKGAPGNRWSTLAGYVEPGESLEAAVVREVSEEVGLDVDACSYVGSQPWPFPASLMVAFDATAPWSELTCSDEHAEVRWFDREDLRKQIETGAIVIPGEIAAGGYLIRRWLG